MGLVVSRQAVVRQLVPRRAGRDEEMELGPDPGVAVQRTEPDRHLVALRPLSAEEARAALRAEGLDAAVRRTEDADQRLAREQGEPVAGDASLRAAERA